MSAPPGGTRNYEQEARASAGCEPNRETRRRAVLAIGVMNRVPFAQARAIYADAVLPILRGMTGTEVDAYLRATYGIDPTGVSAVRNVTRERGF